jgi:sortase A
MIVFFLQPAPSQKIINQNNLKNVSVKIEIPQSISLRSLMEVPNLKINVPVIWDVDGNNKEEYLQALEKGVAHLKNSAKPGEGSNIFIFGHSSYYWYKPGEYKQIFRALDQLKPGDQIILHDQLGRLFKYQVVGQEIVTPDKVEVASPTSFEQLTLMTCWPPNSTTKRLIVFARLI